jgi:hypothetical protein
MDKEILIRRLSIVKLLLRNANMLSQQNELTSFLSILSYHDAIDMYLNVAAEHQNSTIKKEKMFMKDFLGLFPNILHEQSILKLNTNRNNIKHNSTTVGKIEVDSARIAANSFIVDNSKQLFGFEFNEVSLFELISYAEPKKLLIAAQAFLDANNFEDSMLNGIVAFDKLIKQYNANKNGIYKVPNFNFTKDVTFRPGEFGRLEGTERHVKSTVEVIDENFKNISQALEILALGIDYRKYVKLKAISPYRYFYNESNGIITYNTSHGKIWTIEDCNFIIDFVIESSLILQDVDYDVKKLQNLPSKLM